MKTRYLLPLFLLLLLVFTLYSCAPVGVTERQYGFLSGLIHGVIFPIAVVAKVFAMDYDLYAHNNTGLSYWLGYAIGVFCFGGGIFGSKRRR